MSVQWQEQCRRRVTVDDRRGRPHRCCKCDGIVLAPRCDSRHLKASSPKLRQLHLQPRKRPTMKWPRMSQSSWWPVQHQPPDGPATKPCNYNAHLDTPACADDTDPNRSRRRNLKMDVVVNIFKSFGDCAAVCGPLDGAAEAAVSFLPALTE